MSLSTLVPGVRSPDGGVVVVIDDQVTIVLHGQSVWALSLVGRTRSPDGVLAAEVGGVVEDEFSVLFQVKVVRVVLGFQETSGVDGSVVGESVVEFVAWLSVIHGF